MNDPGPSMYLVWLLLLAFSAFFSASETALSSVNKIRLRNRADDGDKRAALALRLADDYDKTLSTILIGNNVVNLSMASLATLIVTSRLGDSGAAIATAVTTVLVLIFGEILPKSFAKEHSETFSLGVARPLQFFRIILTPAVWVFVIIKRIFTGRRGTELNVQPSVTEDELKTIIDTVEEEGVLSQQETGIIQSAIDFDNTTVQEILVPRVDITAVEIGTPPQEILDICTQQGFSRLPVYEGSIDNVVGVLHAKDLLACLTRGEAIDVRALMRDVMFVYRTKKINSLLADFRRTKQHMAIVTDDYGGTAGLVTLEDVLEELVGEIWDETDADETPIRDLGNGRWEVQGDVNIEDLFDAIGFSDKYFDCDYASVAGWALDVLEHIPSAGEGFTYKNLHITVQKVEDQRILSLLVEQIDPKQSEE